jgi:hypothetical protein
MTEKYVRDYSREEQQRQLRFETGRLLADELVVPRLMEIDVQPPTAESLAIAAEVGIKLGRAAHGYERQMGAGALNNALRFMSAEYLKESFMDENFVALHRSAHEAFEASGFKYLKVEFPDTLA